MVRIHGNWCGPDWTAGQVKPAKDMIPSDYLVRCVDRLDCACKVHDIDVFERGGRTRGSDVRLSNLALRLYLDPRNPRSLRMTARFVAISILLGRSDRR
jgi:hypothetical protein